MQITAYDGFLQNLPLDSFKPMDKTSQIFFNDFFIKMEMKSVII